MIRNVHWCSCNAPLFLLEFNEPGIFSADFRKILNTKFHENLSSGGANGRMDGHETNSRIPLVSEST